MADRFKFRPIPANFAARFPDGDYTVGRGADPRGPQANGTTGDKAKEAPVMKRLKSRRTKKPLRPAAE